MEEVFSTVRYGKVDVGMHHGKPKSSRFVKVLTIRKLNPYVKKIKKSSIALSYINYIPNKYVINMYFSLLQKEIKRCIIYVEIFK